MGPSWEPGRRSVKGKPFYCWRSAKTTLYQKQRLSAPTKAGAACRRPKSFLRKDHGERSLRKFMLEPKLRQKIRQLSGRHTRIFFCVLERTSTATGSHTHLLFCFSVPQTGRRAPACDATNGQSNLTEPVQVAMLESKKTYKGYRACAKGYGQSCT